MNVLALLPVVNIKTIASIIAIAQAIVKLVKEVLTAVINAALPFIPNEKVQKIRDFINKIDKVLESIKNWIFKHVK